MKSQKIDLLSISPYIRFVQQFNATDSNYYVPWRIIYDHELIFVTQGDCVVETESEKYVISAGDVHIMKPFVKHRRYVEEGHIFNYYGVHFDFFYDKNNIDFSAHEVYEIPCWDMVEKAIVDLNLIKRKSYEINGLPPYSILKVNQVSKFKQNFANLLETFNSESPSKSIKLRAIFLEIIADILDQVYSNEKTDNINSDIIENYISYIMDNYQHEIDLPNIIRDLGISPSHFRRVFKMITNKAPHEFLIDYRMEQAKKLLLTKKYTISEVSYMVGYDDLHYFSRLFKNKEGISPKTFMELNS